MQEQARPLEVREELVPEADAFARAFDQARHVGDRELAPVGRLDRSEHGRERREGIVRDLRLRVRDAPQQRGLAGVGEADECGVGEQLQPQVELQLFSREAGLGEARSLARRRREALVAATRAAAARHDDARTGMCEIREQLSLVEDLGADRHAQLGVVACRAVLERAAPVPAAAGLHALIRPERREVTQILLGDEHDVAAGAAVAAVRTAFRDVLLAAKREAAVAAPPRLHVDAGAIVEHGATAR